MNTLWLAFVGLVSFFLGQRYSWHKRIRPNAASITVMNGEANERPLTIYFAACGRFDPTDIDVEAFTNQEAAQRWIFQEQKRRAE